MSQAISIDNATLASLDAAASLRNMTREDTLREAVDRLAEYDAWFRAKVEGGERPYLEGLLFLRKSPLSVLNKDAFVLCKSSDNNNESCLDNSC